MARIQGPLMATVLLLISFGLHRTSPLPACPESCSCQRAQLLNCSSSGLSLMPHPIQESVTELDLSHNYLDSVTLHAPHHNLTNICLVNSGITHLSLCIEGNPGSRRVRGRPLQHPTPWNRHGCVSWAPNLRRLSAERNQLVRLPEGLNGSRSLQVLQLSFNRISTLRPEDLHGLQQLKELHLQHNLITSLQPQMIQDLAQLKVLDVSFNMLTSLQPSTYVPLRRIGVDVRLDGNRWQCDCKMRSLRRWIAFDSSRGLRPWSVVCTSPSTLSGADLLQVEEDDLNCLSTENEPALHQDVTVSTGSEILLKSCSTKDSVWWTPGGHVNQPPPGLLISNITERDAGPYVCVSEEDGVVSVFHIHVSKTEEMRRKTRSVSASSQQIPQDTTNRTGEGRNQRATHSDLVLAVCLSVFITFLIAFILGVLARPCIDALCRRVTGKNRSSVTHTVSTVEHRQYDNEAYFVDEEPQETRTHRERRVTFSSVDIKEGSDVQYYDTVASGGQESINTNDIGEDKQLAGHSISESSLQQSRPEQNQPRNLEFEHIPQEKRHTSLSSDSSLSDKELQENQTSQRDQTKSPKSPQLAQDTFQQETDFSMAKEDLQISVAEWLVHTNDTNQTNTEISYENEDNFEFSDSAQSPLATSSNRFDSFNNAEQAVRDDISSSSSVLSEDEPRHYTVNSDREVQVVINKQGGSGCDATASTPCSSSQTSDSDDKPDQYEVRQGRGSSSREGERVTKVTLTESKSQVSSNNSTKQSASQNRKRIPRIPRRLAIKAPPPASDSSDSEQRDVYRTRIPVTVSETVGHEAETQGPVLNLQHTPHIQRGLDTKSPALYASSSSDGEEQTTGHVKHQEQVRTYMEQHPSAETHTASLDPQTQWPLLDLDKTTRIKRRLDVKVQWPSADSSSSGESEDETTGHVETQRQGSVDTSLLSFHESHTSYDPSTRWPELNLEHIPHTKRRLDFKVASPPADSFSEILEERMAQEESISRLQEENSHPETQWPVLDLEHLPRMKRRLDIKARTPSADSPLSSNSEDEATRHVNILEQRKTDTAQHPITTESHEPHSQWPLLDLDQPTHIKRRLDFKARSRLSDSSSNGEDETTGHTEEMEQVHVHVEHHPTEVSQTENHDQQTHWPRLDLECIPQVKRRLDVKLPSPDSHSSSSSVGGEETTGITKEPKQQETYQEQQFTGVSQTVNPDAQTHWPLVDVEHTTRIKRRLDIKAQLPSADSSSSSEDETTGHIQQTYIEQDPMESHDAQTQWPRLDLESIPQVKRRLDIKAQSPASDSSDSSEEETTGIIKEQTQPMYQEQNHIKVSQTPSHDPQTYWPLLDLQHTTSVKRRLDIKTSSAAPDSPSNSDCEDEPIDYTKKQEQGQTHMRMFPVNSHEDAQWPVLNLDHIPPVKRRLDIKPPLPALESSPSSASEDETINYMEKQKQESHTGSYDPDTWWPELDLERISHIKRRLDIKVTSPLADLSSSSDSEDETRRLNTEQHLIHASPTESPDLRTRWPLLDLQNTARIKRRLDVKALLPASDSSCSSDSEDKIEGDTTALSFQKIQTESHDPTWPALHLEHITRVKRRLDFKTVSPEIPYNIEQTDVRMTNQPEDSYSSNSEDESPKPDMEVSATENELTPKAYIPHGSKQDPNVTLETFSVVTEHVGETTHDETTPQINPELQSQWSTMDLGFSRYRKRQITSHEPPKLPASLPPDSPTSSSSKMELDGFTKDYSLSVADGNTTPSNVLPGLGTLQIKRYLDVKMIEKEQLTDSSSVSENESTVERQTSNDESEAIDHRVPDLSGGVPQIKRRLNIRSLQQPTDFLSHSESGNHLRKFTDREEAIDHDSQIQYKRAIFKASSLPSDSYSSWRTDQSTDIIKESNGGAKITTSYSVGERQTVPTISTHDVGKKRWNPFRRPKDVGLPPELQWTGVGRNLSDHSIPVPRKRLHGRLSPPAESEHLAPFSSGESDDEMKQDANMTIMQTYSPSPTPDTFDRSLNSTDWSPATGERGKRKGLSALKAMSSERLMWDTVDEDIEVVVSPDQEERREVGFTRSEDDITPLTKQPKSETLLSSSTLRERRAADLLSGFSRRTLYVTEDTEPPRHLPPPIPATPPPDEEGLTWIV